MYFVRVCNPRMDKMIDVVHTTPGKIENREHYFLQLCLLSLPIRHENQAFRNRRGYDNPDILRSEFTKQKQIRNDR